MFAAASDAMHESAHAAISDTDRKKFCGSPRFNKLQETSTRTHLLTLGASRVLSLSLCCTLGVCTYYLHARIKHITALLTAKAADEQQHPNKQIK